MGARPLHGYSFRRAPTSSLESHVASEQSTAPGAYLEYLNFDMELERHPDSRDGDTARFVVSARSDEGEVQAEFELPFSPAELVGLKFALPKNPNFGRDAFKKHGETLFKTVFSSEIRASFAANKARADSVGKGLRVRLSARDPNLAELPWELLYDPRADFMALSGSTPLVRFSPECQSPTPPARSGPLRVLGVSASPRELQPLRLTVEVERLERIFRTLAPRAELEWLHDASRESLHSKFTERWDVVHFAGHGGIEREGSEGYISLEGAGTREDRFSAYHLAGLLEGAARPRLVVLNACEGASGSESTRSVAAQIIKAGIPAVIGMQYPITDDAALEFSRALYTSVVNGLPIDTAMAMARKALHIKNSMEWITPVLLMRVSDGVLFPKQLPPRTSVSPSSTDPVTTASISPQRKEGQQNRPTQRRLSNSEGRVLLAVSLLILSGAGALLLVNRTAPPAPLSNIHGAPAGAARSPHSSADSGGGPGDSPLDPKAAAPDAIGAPPKDQIREHKDQGQSDGPFQKGFGAICTFVKAHNDDALASMCLERSLAAADTSDREERRQLYRGSVQDLCQSILHHADHGEKWTCLKVYATTPAPDPAEGAPNDGKSRATFRKLCAPRPHINDGEIDECLRFYTGLQPLDAAIKQICLIANMRAFPQRNDEPERTQYRDEQDPCAGVPVYTRQPIVLADQIVQNGDPKDPRPFEQTDPAIR